MKLNIKYIPGIFPSVNFETERELYNFKMMPLKPEITNFLTSERWAFANDSVFINRIKQSIRDKRYELRFTIFETDDLSFVEQTTETQLVTDDFTYTIHNVSVSYEPAGNRKYNVLMTFSIKDYDNITSPVESDFVNDYFTLKTEINFDFVKRFAVAEAFVNGFSPSDPKLLYVRIDNNNIKPVAGEQYYVHSTKLAANIAVEFVQNKFFNPTTGTLAEFKPIEPFTIEFPSTVLDIRDLVLSSVPNIENYNLTENVGSYTIYTAFAAKKLPRIENLGNVQATSGIRIGTDNLTSYTLDLPFFLSGDNLDLGLALKTAKNIKVGNIYANESFEVFEFVQEMINLFEFRLKLNYNIDRI